MRVRFAHQAVVGIVLICQLSACLGTETPDPNQSSKYLDAVRTFADNVLKYGRDTYGPKKTPLFVDGLNIHTNRMSNTRITAMLCRSYTTAPQR